MDKFEKMTDFEKLEFINSNMGNINVLLNGKEVSFKEAYSVIKKDIEQTQKKEEGEQKKYKCRCNPENDWICRNCKDK